MVEREHGKGTFKIELLVLFIFVPDDHIMMMRINIDTHIAGLSLHRDNFEIIMSIMTIMMMMMTILT